jgi:hypothetical protein
MPVVKTSIAICIDNGKNKRYKFCFFILEDELKTQRNGMLSHEMENIFICNSKFYLFFATVL